MTRTTRTIILTCVLLTALTAQAAGGPEIKGPKADKWVTTEGVATGTDEKAKDEAVAEALRKGVERACGVFLTSESKTQDYKAIYDKIFADAVGYVREHKVLKTWVVDGQTHASVRAHVSAQKFEKNWAVIAHTLEQEDNPRVVVAIVEAVSHSTTAPRFDTDEGGIVQGKVEDFFLSKGLSLMDKAMATNVTKRDVLLAALKDDEKEVAAMGARFKADVVVAGRAAAKYGKTLNIEGIQMHQYTATLNVRVIQTDSARVLVSKSFGPETSMSLQRAGAGDKVLSKLAKESAPKLLAAVVEAWRKRANVARTVVVSISGMDFTAWKAFKAEAAGLRGIKALRLREITESVASVNVEYRYTVENLADHLIELKSVKLQVTEISTNRIKAKVVK